MPPAISAMLSIKLEPVILIVEDPLAKILLKLFKIWEYIAPALALPVPLLPARLF